MEGHPRISSLRPSDRALSDGNPLPHHRPPAPALPRNASVRLPPLLPAIVGILPEDLLNKPPLPRYPCCTV